MNRREFVAACSSGALASIRSGSARVARAPWRTADHTLRIAPLRLELAPGKEVRTVAYNGMVPGPLLRMREGAPMTIEVFNDTDLPELVHWHGLAVAADVDGAAEEGTPTIPAHGSRQYSFTPRPAGSRWYHSHAMAGHDLHRATYSGQFGFLLVDPPANPGRYDQELFLALHDWDPYLTGGDDGFQSVAYTHASINGRLLGSADPIRVGEGQRLLLHLLNASASEAHWLSLPGHMFHVIALDGNPVPTPADVELLRLDPGERVDAVVQMDHPGVWILGETRAAVRRAGMGVVVEYAGQGGAPQWTAPAGTPWSYLPFGRANAAVAPAASGTPQRVPLVFRSAFHGHGAFEGWTINGKSFPHTDTVDLEQGRRYRLAFDNQSAEDHPVHLHRHTMELCKVGAQATAGILKDVVTVPAGTVTEVEFTADNPGKTLFHCHLQDHMDAGFMMLFDYR